MSYSWGWLIFSIFFFTFIVFGEETPTSTTKGSKWGRNRFFCFCITKKYDIIYDIIYYIIYLVKER